MAPNPHDLFVRSWLSLPSEAAAFFRLFLPAALRSAVDLDSVRLVPGTFIEQRLRESVTDLLFEVMVAGRKTLIYLLLEHQSTVDRWMPLRVDRYIRRIWEAWRARHPAADCLPLVIPIVLYHGDRPWSGPRCLRDLIDLSEGSPPALSAWLPGQDFILVDLWATPDEVLRAAAIEGSAQAASSLFMLKYVRRPGFREWLREWRRLLAGLIAAPNGWDAFCRLINYVLMVRDDFSAEEVARMFEEVAGPKAGEAAMSIAERLIQEGHAKGRNEGRNEGRILLSAKLRRLLLARFGPIDAESDARLAAADLPALDVWFDRALTAATLQAVFDDAPRGPS